MRIQAKLTREFLLFGVGFHQIFWKCIQGGENCVHIIFHSIAVQLLFIQFLAQSLDAESFFLVPIQTQFCIKYHLLQIQKLHKQFIVQFFKQEFGICLQWADHKTLLSHCFHQQFICSFCLISQFIRFPIISFLLTSSHIIAYKMVYPWVQLPFLKLFLQVSAMEICQSSNNIDVLYASNISILQSAIETFLREFWILERVLDINWHSKKIKIEEELERQPLV